MAREPSQKLVDYGIIAGIALAAYFVYTAFFKKEAPKVCPPGQHPVNPCEDQMGWPAFLCNLGRNVTGAFLDCKPDVVSPVIPLIPGVVDLVCPAGTILENGVCKPVNVPVVPLPRDTFGCLVSTERWCPIDKKCMDNSRSCTPDPALIPSPGACYEWSPTFHKWLYSPTMPGCEGIKPPVLPKCPESECTPGTIMCDNGIPKVCVQGGIGCEDRGIWSIGGNACKPVSNIQKCPNAGLVDLNNPPGTTLAEACAVHLKPEIGACVYDCQGAEPGHGSSCGSAEFCGVKVAREGWEMVGTECCNAPKTAQCWKKCIASGGYIEPTRDAKEAIYNAWIAECRGAGHSVGGLPVDTPRGTFTDPRTWTNEFGHTYISEIAKNFSGGEFPWAGKLVCYQE